MNSELDPQLKFKTIGAEPRVCFVFKSKTIKLEKKSYNVMIHGSNRINPWQRDLQQQAQHTPHSSTDVLNNDITSSVPGAVLICAEVSHEKTLCSPQTPHS